MTKPKLPCFGHLIKRQGRTTLLGKDDTAGNTEAAGKRRTKYVIH